AFAQEKVAESEKRVVSCSGCHEFHIYGPAPTSDFPKPAPHVRPHIHQGLTLAIYVPAIAHANGEIQGVTMRHLVVSPWWIGVLALVATGTMFGAWTRFMPRLIT